ncbi:response regulator [Granulosicoccus sp. 3-233]|uniref:response regulator n=1 Tax=Granulosicoccus sp. 3-233 TaxID=3417969 RepID=UPI003D335886
MKHSDNGHSATEATGEMTAPTVLLVDDSKTVRQSAQAILESEGYRVVTAVDGFEALALVVEHRPALVLADIMMPRLDGYQTCALIRNNADHKAIPVVMLSSKDGLFDKARGRIVGSNAHLSKPFTAESLLAAVRRHIPIPLPARDVPVATASKADEPAETSDA